MAVNPKTLWMGDVSYTRVYFFVLVSIAPFRLWVGGTREATPATYIVPRKVLKIVFLGLARKI